MSKAHPTGPQNKEEKQPKVGVGLVLHLEETQGKKRLGKTVLTHSKTWIQGMVNRRLDFLFFLSAQLFRASLLSFLYRSLRSLSVDLKVSFTAPSLPKGSSVA